MMRGGSMAMKKVLALAVGLGLSCLAQFGSASAQSLRDPTLPPLESGLVDPATRPVVLGAEPGAMSIIVRSGRPYLVVGTRLLSQGQKLGQARIERISETEVWLREDGVLRKVAQFPGIERHAAKADCAANSSNSPSRVAPCSSVQPSGLSQ